MREMKVREKEIEEAEERELRMALEESMRDGNGHEHETEGLDFGRDTPLGGNYGRQPSHHWESLPDGGFSHEVGRIRPLFCFTCCRTERGDDEEEGYRSYVG